MALLGLAIILLLSSVIPYSSGDTTPPLCCQLTVSSSSTNTTTSTYSSTSVITGLPPIVDNVTVHVPTGVRDASTTLLIDNSFGLSTVNLNGVLFSPDSYGMQVALNPSPPFAVPQGVKQYLTLIVVLPPSMTNGTYDLLGFAHFDNGAVPFTVTVVVGSATGSVAGQPVPFSATTIGLIALLVIISCAGAYAYVKEQRG